MTKDQLQPIRKILVVGLPIGDAFSAFTRDIGQWWPLRTQSLELEGAKRCVLEGWEGGSLYETADDLPPQVWAQVVTWTRPSHLVLSWGPGDLEDTVTEIQVRFDSIGERRSRVELVHAGWKPDLLDRYVDHQRGWDAVLVHGYQAYTLKLIETGDVGQAS